MIRHRGGVAVCLVLLFLLAACQSYGRSAYTSLAKAELEQEEATVDRCVALLQGAAALREGDDHRWAGPFGTGQAMEATAVKFDRQAVVCQLLVTSDDEVSKQRALMAWRRLWRTGLESVGGGS